MNLFQAFEGKESEFNDISTAGLDFYVGGVCYGEEPLCMLLRQLSFDRGHFRNNSRLK